MKYELTLLLEEKISTIKKKKLTQVVEKIIDSVSGKVIDSKDWGVLELAYPIKKARSGLYLFFEIEVLPDKVKLIRDKLKMEDNILRYLLVKSD